MGCSFSCKKLAPKSKHIRIVDLKGLVQEIGYPITVGEVIGKSGKHFLFSQAQLLAAAATPLKLDAALEAGRLYFLLPTTLFHSSMSLQELVPVARKLASIAQNTPSKSKFVSPAVAHSDDKVVFNNRSVKSRSWKPILSTIRERSFNRRSESDLQSQESKIDNK